ncbi:lipopolysaccharide assembly protein LapA domain-containing protein [Streptomyces sp. JNUCC 64]
MSPKTTTTKSRSSLGELATPGRIVVIVLAVLALVFIFENTQEVEIRLLIPQVTMPLWVALLAMWLIGALCGAYFLRRRDRR